MLQGFAQRARLLCYLPVGQSLYSVVAQTLQNSSVRMLQVDRWRYRSVFLGCNPLDVAPTNGQSRVSQDMARVLTSKEKFLYGAMKLTLWK